LLRLQLTASVGHWLNIVMINFRCLLYTPGERLVVRADELHVHTQKYLAHCLSNFSRIK